jgi:hypothetical protein
MAKKSIKNSWKKKGKSESLQTLKVSTTAAKTAGTDLQKNVK